ncbi:MAG: hypothetical protein QOH05_2634 [Acetobacteraceae bacterium]|jgi:threonine/homoserine/homoserine lactone efflux protein|nr:hypothetical protein [Acetobacteraceae bacterium]
MTDHVPLLAGILAGFAIAVPVGPMGLLCIQRTLASGMKVGVSTGLGAATVNVAYGGMILLGMDTLSPWMAGSRRLFSAASGLFLLWSAVRLLVRGRGPRIQPGGIAPSPSAAYGSAVAFNATNPMALILVMAVLSPIAHRSAASFIDGAMLLLGMFIAAATWWVCLSGGVSLLRTRLSPAVLAHVNHAAGLLLTVYGALALARSVHM